MANFPNITTTYQTAANTSSNQTCSAISLGYSLSTWQEFFACYVYFLPQQLPISIISYVIILGSIVFNVAIIILLACKGKYKTVFDEILISHGVINLLTGGVDLQFYVAGWLFNYWAFDKFTCIAWLVFDNMLATSEILHVLYLGWVRVRCVLRPKSFKKEIWVKRSTLVLSIIWFAPAAIWLALALPQNLLGFQQYTCQIEFNPPALSASIAFILMILPISLIIVSTLYMIKALDARRKRMTNHRPTPASNGTQTNVSSTRKTSRIFRTQKKLTIIISVFLIQYSPYSFMWFVDLLCNNCVPSMVYTVLVLLTFMPSLSNPLLIIILNLKVMINHKFRNFN